MAENFVHLNIHSDYSIEDGIIPIDSKSRPTLAKVARQMAMPAVALTDLHNTFALVKHYKACIDNGVKPILGAEIRIKLNLDDKNTYRIVILCQNNKGFLNLKQLLSKSYLRDCSQNKKNQAPMVLLNELIELSTGLIVLLGQASPLGELYTDKDIAHAFIQQIQEAFDNRIYLEIQRIGRINEAQFNQHQCDTAQTFDLPLVATNASRFINKDDFDVHEVRICISQGDYIYNDKRERKYTTEQYFKSSQQMEQLFSDIPSALQNTLEIAKRCSVELQLGKNFLPDFPIPDNLSMDEYFRQLCHQGLEERFNSVLKAQNIEIEQYKEEYIKRLDRELDVIISMGFPGYFLIVAEFIGWSKKNNIPVGPGRGSGAGSLVAFALSITDLDPIQYDLLFERFLNPERVSMPDFDIDFCMEGRDTVIAHVAELYGKDRVSQIITYGKMAAKAAVRDVGRVQGLSYPVVDGIAKLIPDELNITLSKALEQSIDLKSQYDQEETVRDLIDMALSLEGTVRNVGKHAGGVVISPSDINDFSAIYRVMEKKPAAEGEIENNIVTQFDKKDVELVGLVKFDFLGLKTLTIIKWALEMINQQCQQRNQDPVDINTIPLEDTAAFDVIKNSDTTAVFQLESSGMKQLIHKMQPDCFEDIVALVALYRPGPLGAGMDVDFIERKHGRQLVKYPHPSLEEILKPTYGTILYQEQVMQISQVMAGYTLGGADLLRRAMGKKMPEEMAKQRSIFVEGAINNNIDEKIATHIFDQMEMFAAYGFNKSHSAAYALVSYQTLWLKAHYRAPFMAAVLSGDMDNTDKIVMVIEECRQQKMNIRMPDINESCYRFSVTNDQQIIYGLGAIKGLGSSAIEDIIDKRKQQAFIDFQDFCNRVDLRKVNQRAIETLIKSGAMDNLGLNRATMFNAIDEATKIASQNSANRRNGQTDLFGSELFSMHDNNETTNLFDLLKEWPLQEKLRYEKAALGLYLSGHPLDEFEKDIKHITTHNINELNAQKKHRFIIVGLIAKLQTRYTKTNKKMVNILIDDKSERREITLFEEDYEKYKDLLIVENIIFIQGDISINPHIDRERIRIEDMMDLNQAMKKYARWISIYANSEYKDNELHKLIGKLSEYRSENSPSLRIFYQQASASCELRTGQDWCIEPNRELLEEYKEHTHLKLTLDYP